MTNDALLKLRMAFSHIPMKGLFFWEGLLFLDDEQYKKNVEDNLTELINQEIPQEDQDLKTYYTEILNALKEVRQAIQDDPQVKNSVTTIRDSLITEATDKILIQEIQEAVLAQNPQ